MTPSELFWFGGVLGLVVGLFGGWLYWAEEPVVNTTLSDEKIIITESETDVLTVAFIASQLYVHGKESSVDYATALASQFVHESQKMSDYRQKHLTVEKPSQDEEERYG